MNHISYLDKQKKGMGRNYNWDTMSRVTEKRINCDKKENSKRIYIEDFCILFMHFLYDYKYKFLSKLSL